jgi:hypothetical protein
MSKAEEASVERLCQPGTMQSIDARPLNDEDREDAADNETPVPVEPPRGGVPVGIK